MPATRTRRAAREEQLQGVDPPAERASSEHERKRQRSVAAPEERKTRRTSKRPRPRSPDVRTSHRMSQP